MAYYFQSGFFAAHLTVWAMAALLFVLQLGKIRDLSTKVRTLQRISEGEFRRYTYPVDKFEQYFDYCASVFIFIGLIGTMYGFIQAVPELQNSAYDFHHFRDALTVSVFGIIWSTLLAGIVSVHRLFFISPVFESLLKKQNLDQLASLLGQELNRFGTQITADLNRGLGDFSLAANNIGNATIRLADTADGAAKSFTASSEALNRSAKTVNDIYDRAKSLPQSISDDLKKIFDLQNSLLKSTFDAQLEHLNTGSGAIRTTFEKSNELWESARNTALKEARAKLKEFLVEVQSGYQGILLEEQQKLAAGTVVAVSSIRTLLDEFDSSLQSVEKTVPEAVRKTYSDAVAKIALATNKIAAATENAAHISESLNQSASEAQRGVAALGDVLRSLAASVNRLDSAQISSVSRKLDEVLRTIDTGVRTEQRGPEPPSRRWRPWSWLAGHRRDQ